MDITPTLEANSDQLDAVDLITGPRTFTITDVQPGSKEQPVRISLAEFPKPWHPSKSMRRVMAAIWGTKGKEWVGKRLTLFNDPSVVYGGKAVGGIRISHMQDLTEARKIMLLVTRGKSAPFTVQPLVEAPALTVGQIGQITDPEELRALWAEHPTLRDAITQRANQLKQEDTQ